MKETSFHLTELKDIDLHWAKAEIIYVLSHGLLQGISTTCFKPEAPVTRGIFVTALYKLAHLEPEQRASFYKDWALQLRLLEPLEDGSFGERFPLTREETAVAMVRFAAFMEFPLRQVYLPKNFTDYKNIDDSCAESVQIAQLSGLISSRGNYRFVPKSKLTRAEFAAILFRYAEQLIRHDYGVGWRVNDAGRWMFYQRGKPLTGRKVVDGIPYTFNRYGEITTDPTETRHAFYQTRMGDTWRKIAQNRGCDAFSLARLNGKSVNSLVHAGELIKVPR